MEDTTFQLPSFEWLTDWRRTGVEVSAQREYVESELRMLQEQGMPLLFAALTAPLPVQTDLALSILTTDRTFGSIWRLRLRPGVEPPSLDPQGRPVPPAKRGQLIAKVGTVGGKIVTGKDSEAIIASCGGAALKQRSLLNRDLNVYRDVPLWGVDLTTEEALSVLRKWGAGCLSQRYTGGRRKPIQDHWLVVECCDAWDELLGPVPPKPVKATPAPKAQPTKPVKQAEQA